MAELEDYKLTASKINLTAVITVTGYGIREIDFIGLDWRQLKVKRESFQNWRGEAKMGWLLDFFKIKGNWYFKILMGYEDWRDKTKSDFGLGKIKKGN